jgi:predicted alpha/beta hydrolase family esterase
MKQVIILHGKDKSSEDIWYPWLRDNLRKRGLKCYSPDLPNASSPKIKEWLNEVNALKPNEETILVGHSRGGMAILRWLETSNMHVAKVILVATNSANIEDSYGGDFYSGSYDFSTIRKHCSNFVVLHSKDDRWVPYSAGIENTNALNAKLISFENKAHFGAQSDGSVMLEFPELLDEVLTF